MPQEWSFCLATNAWAWAVGSSGERLPDHVGMPLGEAHGGATYFMLETHYDNPGIDPDLVDKSGLRIYYTDKLRYILNPSNSHTAPFESSPLADILEMLLGSKINSHISSNFWPDHQDGRWVI